MDDASFYGDVLGLPFSRVQDGDCHLGAGRPSESFYGLSEADPFRRLAFDVYDFIACHYPCAECGGAQHRRDDGKDTVLDDDLNAQPAEFSLSFYSKIFHLIRSYVLAVGVQFLQHPTICAGRRSSSSTSSTYLSLISLTTFTSSS